MTPSGGGPGKLVYDVESQSTAPELRAPYGDSYNINRLERPFDQDMAYNSNVDVLSYTVAGDDVWWYVSLTLIGSDPNSAPGINYGVELDLNHDGFGEYLVLAHPPYTAEWDTLPVQVLQDTNHDTGGLSAEQSDAPMTTDGYDKLIFSGGPGDADPDMAWVRLNAGTNATLQLAFKRSWAGTVFMLGVFADAGLKDPRQLDYVDRFKEADAGSPVRDKPYYPLGALFLVDNVCRQAFGFQPTGFEPQLCPTEPPPTGTPKPTQAVCQPEPPGCPAPSVWNEAACACVQICLSKGTRIDTPQGPMLVEALRPGDSVWTLDDSATRVAAPILLVSRPRVDTAHKMVHVMLDDGRQAWVSPGHPTADGRSFGELLPGDRLDGAQIALLELVPYAWPETYDLLPAGETGYYWANGILMGSTLSQP
jgi:hypothetical protein